MRWASGSWASRASASLANGCSARLRAPCSHHTCRVECSSASTWSIASTGVAPTPALISTTGRSPGTQHEGASRRARLDDVADAEPGVQVLARRAVGFALHADAIALRARKARQRVGAQQGRGRGGQDAAERSGTDRAAPGAAGSPSTGTRRTEITVALSRSIAATRIGRIPAHGELRPRRPPALAPAAPGRNPAIPRSAPGSAMPVPGRGARGPAGTGGHRPRPRSLPPGRARRGRSRRLRRPRPPRARGGRSPGRRWATSSAGIRGSPIRMPTR